MTPKNIRGKVLVVTQGFIWGEDYSGTLPNVTIHILTLTTTTQQEIYDNVSQS